MMPPFHGERMRAYGHDMARITDDIVDGWRDGAEILLHKELQEVTLRVILRSVFGMTEGPRTRRARPAHRRVPRRHHDAVVLRRDAGALGRARARLSARRGAHMLDAEEAHAVALAASRGSPIASAPSTPSSSTRSPAAARSPTTSAPRARTSWRCWSPPATTTAPRFGDDELRDHLMTLLVGGHETTATSLSWALACALQNPGTLDAHAGRGRQRLRRRLRSDQASSSSSYLGAVANESMRLYPDRHRGDAHLEARPRARRLHAAGGHARLALHLSHAARRAPVARARRLPPRALPRRQGVGLRVLPLRRRRLALPRRAVRRVRDARRPGARGRARRADAGAGRRGQAGAAWLHRRAVGRRAGARAAAPVERGDPPRNAQRARDQRERQPVGLRHERLAEAVVRRRLDEHEAGALVDAARVRPARCWSIARCGDSRRAGRSGRIRRRGGRRCRDRARSARHRSRRSLATRPRLRDDERPSRRWRRRARR